MNNRNESQDTDNQSERNPLQLIHNTLQAIDNLDELLESPLTSSEISFSLTNMNRVELRHLGLDLSYLEHLSFGQCMTIFESSKFDIAVFLLPRGFVLKLHDHPNMVVCSKILAGSVSIRSFSRLENIGEDEVLANLKFNITKSSDDEAWTLTPDDGNFHEITPLTDCVMLDLLLPPYDDENRPCNFYSASPYKDGERWLLKSLSPDLQEKVQLPHTVRYQGYRPVVESPSTDRESYTIIDSGINVRN
jgi:hypothetical protein